MYITIPDQYPGRCCNYRLINGQMERCLDYDGVKHTCSFPEPPPKTYTMTTATIQTTYNPQKPKPWVKPGDEASDS